MKIHLLFVALASFSAVGSAPAQPALSIARGNNQIVLIWPATAANYVLQSTTNLLSPDWEPVNDAVQVTVNNAINASVTNTSSARFFRLYNGNPPAGMALIPAGSFTIGNSIGDSDIHDATPTNVYVSAFYMDANLVRYDQWQSVYNWATNHGYNLINGYVGVNNGYGRAPNQPVLLVTWYQAAKWCNARSQMEGLTPVYYTDVSLTQVYTNGLFNLTNADVNWAANGYRLPTEAEWEKAARGGLSGRRFPWGNVIDESLANYLGQPNSYPTYDNGPNGYNTNVNFYVYNVYPNTSPVGFFGANGYGLYDMAGNANQWCWDWYQGYPNPYPAGSPYLGGTDPCGPAGTTSFGRVVRGGDWGFGGPPRVRCAYRSAIEPTAEGATDGAAMSLSFRCVRGH